MMNSVLPSGIICAEAIPLYHKDEVMSSYGCPLMLLLTERRLWLFQ